MRAAAGRAGGTAAGASLGASVGASLGALVGAGALAAAPLAPGGRLAAQAGRWAVGAHAGADAGVIRNPRYVVGNDSVDVLTRAQLGGVLARRGERWNLTAAASGDHQHFRLTPSLTQFNYGASADADGYVTQRFRARAGVTARRLLTRGVFVGGVLPPAVGAPAPERPAVDSAAGGAGAGAVPAPAPVPAPVPAPGPGAGTAVGAGAALPLLPLLSTVTYGGSAGMEYRLSPRTTAAADVGYAEVRFSAPNVRGGSTVQLRGRAARLLGERTTAAASAQMDRVSFGGAAGLAVTSLAAEWTRTRLPGNTRLRLGAGAAVLETVAGGPLALRPVGSAELTGVLARGAWGVHVARAALPAQGLGQVLVSEQLGGSYTRALPGRLRAVAAVEHATLRTPAAARLVTDIARLEVQRALPGNLWVGVGGSQFTRAQGDAVRSRDMTVRLGWVRAPGGGRATQVVGPVSSETP